MRKSLSIRFFGPFALDNHTHKRAMKGKFGPKDGRLISYVAPFVFIGLLLVLVLVNIKHSIMCTSQGESGAEAALKRQALDRRLLSLEQETLQNNMLFEKLIRRLDEKFELTKGVSLRDLKDTAHVDGLTVSAILAEEPAPPMPSFEELYADAKTLNDAIDTAMESLDDYAYNFEQAQSLGESQEEPYEQEMQLMDDKSQKLDDFTASPFDDPPKQDPIPESEARPACLEWKKQYNVQPGVSWGNLPLDMQDKWKLYECDSFTLNEFGF